LKSATMISSGPQSQEVLSATISLIKLALYQLPHNGRTMSLQSLSGITTKVTITLSIHQGQVRCHRSRGFSRLIQAWLQEI